jgi:hypothetical protein
MLSEMSDDLNVKLYFGNGQIRYGEHGVDLSEFNSIDRVLKRAASRTFGSITQFFRAFHVDAQQHDLSIMATEMSHYVGSLCHFKALNIGGVISK